MFFRVRVKNTTWMKWVVRASLRCTLWLATAIAHFLENVIKHGAMSVPIKRIATTHQLNWAPESLKWQLNLHRWCSLQMMTHGNVTMPGMQTKCHGAKGQGMALKKMKEPTRDTLTTVYLKNLKLEQPQFVHFVIKQ